MPSGAVGRGVRCRAARCALNYLRLVVGALSPCERRHPCLRASPQRAQSPAAHAARRIAERWRPCRARPLPTQNPPAERASPIAALSCAAGDPFPRRVAGLAVCPALRYLARIAHRQACHSPAQPSPPAAHANAVRLLCPASVADALTLPSTADPSGGIRNPKGF